MQSYEYFLIPVIDDKVQGTIIDAILLGNLKLDMQPVFTIINEDFYINIGLT